MNIYIGEPKTITISDMQGPCPDGFHIPTRQEWNGLDDIMYGLGLSGSNHWREKLHLPRVMTRSYKNGNITDQGYGQYWSSQLYTYGSYDDTAYCYTISNDTSSTGGSTVYVCSGLGIRPFYNNFVVPTSSWTVVYGTLGSAGIFWNQSEGIISITSNGTTGYTIADKNLGATTIYNNGDTLSESNCGKLYQWGNNYGFPYSGSVTTSSTKVDASGYGLRDGQGKYYESSTFIISTSSPYHWYSNRNQNLWGGVSQGTSTKTEYQEVQNIYIGEYGWKPLNPKCWYKFDGDYTDATGTYGVASGTSTFQTLSSGVKVLQTNGSNTVNLPGGVTSSSLTTWTIAFWCKPLDTAYFAGCNGDSYYYDLSFYMSTAGRCYAEWSGGISSHAIATIDKTDSSLSNNWRLFILKSDGTKVYMNINGSAFDEVTPNNTSIFRTMSQFAIGGRSPGVQMGQVLMSNFVISNTYWDDATCLDMYNKTKANYGL